MITSRDTVNALASDLKVSAHGGDDTCRWWLVVPQRGGPPTYVLQGPCSLVVTGDLASMLFERSGVVPPGFVRRDLDVG